MSNTAQPPWLTEAWSLLGLTEGTGTRNNPRIVALYRDAGHPVVRHDSVAWCAAFVGACLQRAGHEPSGSLLARSYLEWGETIDTPRIGAIAVFPRGRNPALGHVGFVVGITDDTLSILGGNQDDAVSVVPYALADALGLHWPSTLTPAAADRSNFDLALDHVFEMEGGYTDDPHDPGGPTNLGITLATYANWRHVEVTPETFPTLKSELRDLDRATAGEIFRQRYWTRSAADRLPAALALMHFDAAVNHGVAGSAGMLRELLEVDGSGLLGDDEIDAAAAQSVATLIERYAALRTARYRALPHFWRFGRGWLNRVAKTRAAARALLPSTPSRKDTPMTDTNTPTSTPPKWWGASMTIWGTIITALATVIPAIGPLIGLDITGEMIITFGHSVTAVLQAIGGIIGTIMAILGRVRAHQPLMRRDVAVRL